MNSKKPSTKLPQKEKTQVHKIEKIGYKVANKVHKFAVLSMVSFIIFNIFLFGKQYNDHWRARRNPNFISDIEKRNNKIA